MVKILIIKLSSFGDIIHSLPVLARLRELYPQASISWLVSHKFVNLLNNHPDINNIYTLNSSLTENINTLKKLKKENYTHVLDLQGLIKTALMGCFVSNNNLYGLAPTRELPAQYFYKYKLNSPDDFINSAQHVIDRNLKILELLDINSTSQEIKYNLPEILLTEKYQELLNNQKYIIVSTQTRWESKSWYDWHLLLPELINKLQEYNLKLVLLGTEPEDYKINHSNFINLTGHTSFDELKSLVCNAELMLGLDSGILHLAEAYNIKTVGLYGSTSAIRTGNYSGISISNNLPCSPCHKRVCKYNNSQYMQCMKAITVQEVLNSVLSNLNNC